MPKKLLLVIILFSAYFSFAQDFGDFQSGGGGSSQFSRFADRPAQYILGSGDILLINVNLWGHVQRPGIYSVPSSYTLIDLISSAGGPLSSARLDDIRIIRKNMEVAQVDVEYFLDTGDYSVLPVLRPGDTIVIAGSMVNVFTTVVAIFRDIAIIVNVFILASRI